MLTIDEIRAMLGDEGERLLGDFVPRISKDVLQIPSGNHVENTFASSDRNAKVLENLKRIYGTGRLANTGYLSILPVDQGLEHMAGYEFANNPMYFNPENIIKLAVESQCNAVASSFGVLGLYSQKYADQIPFIVKINHSEMLTYPHSYDQRMFGSVERAFNMGAAAVGATVYFGHEYSRDQIEEIAEAFAIAHELGMATVLWCYVRNDKLADGYTSSADITAQANHIGVTLQADIIKQKLPEWNGFIKNFNEAGNKYAMYNDEMYQLASDHPIDLVRYQVLHCYAGKISLLNSGGDVTADDFQSAVRAAVINKRAGGAGLIMGRKAFKRPFAEGVKLLQMTQDVYAMPEVTIA